MVSIRKYEDDLYYPFYINHRFTEMQGKHIKELMKIPPSIWDLTYRIEILEKELTELREIVNGEVKL